MRGLNFNGLENVLLILFSQRLLSSFFGLFSFLVSLRWTYFSDFGSLDCVFGVWKVYTLSLRCPKEHIFKHCVAVKTWGSFLCSILVLVWWPPGAYVHSRPMQPSCVWAAIKNTCYLDWWWERGAVFLSMAEFSTPDWPLMFHGQKSSKILICRCVTVPSADFWRGGLVLTRWVPSKLPSDSVWDFAIWDSLTPLK